jgi:hypothetical protein
MLSLLWNKALKTTATSPSPPCLTMPLLKIMDCQVDPCGSYAWHLGFVAENLPCHSALFQKRALFTCSLLVQAPCFIAPNMTCKTLQDNMTINIIKIAKFDEWISHSSPFEIVPPIQATDTFSITNTILKMEQGHPAKCLTYPNFCILNFSNEGSQLLTRLPL